MNLSKAALAFEQLLMSNLRSTTASRRFRYAYLVARNQQGLTAKDALEVAKQEIRAPDESTTTALASGRGPQMLAAAKMWLARLEVDLAGLKPFREGSKIWFAAYRSQAAPTVVLFDDVGPTSATWYTERPGIYFGIRPIDQHRAKCSRTLARRLMVKATQSTE